MGNIMATTYTHEFTFLSMKAFTKNGYDLGKMLINVDNFPYDGNLILTKGNENYEKIYNTLQKGKVYRFTISMHDKHANEKLFDFNQDMYVVDIHEQLTYVSTIKVTKLFDMKKQELYANFDYHQIEYDCDNGYRALYDDNDNNRVEDFEKGRKIRLIIENGYMGNIQCGNYYVLKFKKYPNKKLYYVCEYEKIHENGGSEMVRLL